MSPKHSMYKIAYFLLIFLSGSCSNKLEETISNKGFELTESEFVRAVGEGDVEASVSFLKLGYSTESKNGLQETPLIAATKNNRTNLAKALIAGKAFLENRDIEGMTALCWAARRGHTELADELIEAGSFVDTPDLKYGVTPLMFACFESHLFTVKMLIKKGADVNHRNKDGGTALMNAAYSGNVDIVEELLFANADPNLQVFNGFTALMFAVQGNHSEVVETLLKFKADKTLRDNQGLTAKEMATELGHNHLLPLFD